MNPQSVFSSSRNPLKFTVEDATSVQLYPETDEPVNILNIKRGIISALLLPVMEDEQRSLVVSISSKTKKKDIMMIIAKSLICCLFLFRAQSTASV